MKDEQRVARAAHRCAVHGGGDRRLRHRRPEPPEAKEGGQKIIDHYVDNKDSIQISSLLVGIAGVLLVFFFGYVRKVLHSAEGEGGMLSVVALVGAAIVATGVAIDATLAFALSEAADDIDPAAAQAIEAIWDNDFLPMMVGHLGDPVRDGHLGGQARRAAEVARLGGDCPRGGGRDADRLRRPSWDSASGS